MYFLALEQIATHLVVETNCASARVYTCSPGTEEGADGYTAREWLTGMDDAVFVEYWASCASRRSACPTRRAIVNVTHQT